MKNLRTPAAALAILDERGSSWTDSELSKLLRLGLKHATPEGVACLQKHVRISANRKAERTENEKAAATWAAAVGSAA